MTEGEEPYPSLSDYHDYEPNLEFDDTELQSPSADIGKLYYIIIYITTLNLTPIKSYRWFKCRFINKKPIDLFYIFTS